MKNLQRNIYWLLCTALLACICLYGIYLTAASRADICSFSVSAPAGTEEISVYDAGDGNLYVFLPAYAEMEQVTVSADPHRRITLGEVTLSDGMDCGQFSLETPYSFSVDNRAKGDLWFYRSTNVAAVYIDTETGTMNRIHKDKDHEETTCVTVYSADGKLDYQGKNDLLKGRGNSTWEYDKRPYALQFADGADLLDMGTGQNWVLLANALDETNLNNYLALQLAAAAGLPWAPECRFCDLYLNGEYSGLYLLTEKVEVGAERLNIDTTAGDFLCKIDFSDRRNSLRNPFLTNAGRTVELCYPDAPETSQYTDAISLVNRLESVILGGTDLAAEEILDLDSWVRRYLIDEITGNIDSDLASGYFYYAGGKFYAGPVWDYDLSLGNSTRNQAPNAFIAKNAKKSEDYVSPYYSALYNNESFYNRMVEIYRQEFAPRLQQMIGGEIQTLSDSINGALDMNRLRWQTMYDELLSWKPDTVRNTADLIDYLDRRVTFLNRAWLENREYCTVQFEFAADGPYWNLSVPKGQLLETSYVDLTATQWIDAATGQVFDLSQPVTTDLLLISASGDQSTFAMSDYLAFFTALLLLALFAGLVAYDIARRKKERGSADATKISP